MISTFLIPSPRREAAGEVRTQLLSHSAALIHADEEFEYRLSPYEINLPPTNEAKSNTQMGKKFSPSPGKGMSVEVNWRMKLQH